MLKDNQGLDQLTKILEAKVFAVFLFTRLSEMLLRINLLISLSIMIVCGMRQEEQFTF